MLQHLIIHTFEEKGKNFNLRPFDLVEDLHEKSKRSIGKIGVNNDIMYNVNILPLVNYF